jgi:hypothetical protein
LGADASRQHHTCDQEQKVLYNRTARLPDVIDRIPLCRGGL